MMFLLLPLLAIAAADPDSKNNVKKLRSATANAPMLGLSPQIVGGENVSSITQIPWQVLVFNTKFSGICGGALIDDDWVLTAAHCIENKGAYPETVDVMFGATVHRGFQEKKIFATVSMANIIVHENYDAKKILNDIALIKLHVPIPLSKTKNKNIVTIKLPSSADAKKGKTYAGEEVFLSGWGKTNDSEPSSNFLKWVNTTVMTNEDCNTAIGGILDQHICVKAEVGGQSSCEGDSGGPMSYYNAKDKSYTLLGLTSFGGKCSDGSPGVYVRLTYYLPWISKKSGLRF